MEKQEWMERIEQEFNSQTSEQLNHLVNQCSHEFENDDMITGIINNIRKTNNISFSQWKALKAELRKHFRHNPIKRL